MNRGVSVDRVTPVETVPSTRGRLASLLDGRCKESRSFLAESNAFGDNSIDASVQWPLSESRQMENNETGSSGNRT